MKKYFVFIFLLNIVQIALCQEEIPAFGKADLQELQMKECSFEKEAGAMKLLDQQETEISISYDLKIEINRRIRIKIFNKKGFDAANVIIPYIKRNRTSKVTDISAYIFNLDPSGKVITQKLEKKQIFRERSEDGISKVAFAFPDVQEGSVIEYRYTHSEKNILHLDPWFFQAELPTKVSICKFVYPKDVKLDFRFITSDSVVNNYTENYVKVTRTFVLKDIHAFRPEPMMSSIKDNLQRVEFAFLPRLSFFDPIGNDFNRWGIFNRSLLMSPYFGLQITTPIPGTESILDSTKRISVYSEKIHYIYKMVKQNLKWNDHQSFYADDLAEVWKLKSGNSAEINLTILNLLIKSDVPCYPILISTRNNGKADPNFISLGQFNGVDVLVLDSTGFFILDGTQKYISYKTTPYNILNRDVFIIDRIDSKWVNIGDERQLMQTSIAVKAELDNNGELKGQAFISFYEHSKAFKLEEDNEKEKTKEEEDKEFIGKESADLVIDSLAEENSEDELLPLIHRFNFRYKLSNTDDYHFLDPFFLSNFRKNPFSDILRRTDIDMGSNQSYTMYLHLTIPGHYEIDDLPNNILLRASDSSMMFKRQILQEGNILVFRNSFNIQRTIFSKDEYPAIRDFFRKMYGVIGDLIVLKKKK